jgi:hypothetical protein
MRAGTLVCFTRGVDVNRGIISISGKTRMRAAFALAIAADLVQMAIFPLFIEGAASPADDILDLAVAGALSSLLGFNWEFLPSFLAKLVPGVDFIPLWTMAVANVYRRRKPGEANEDRNSGDGPVIEGEPFRNATAK